MLRRFILLAALVALAAFPAAAHAGIVWGD